MALAEKGQTPKGLRRLFFTEDRRLNLFWRILLYLVGITPVFPLFFLFILPFLLIMQKLGWPQPALNALSGVLYGFFVIGWTFLFRRFIDKRPWRGIGLTPLRKALPLALTGFLLALVLLGMLFTLEYAFGWIQIVGTELSVSSVGSVIGTMLLSLVTIIFGAGIVEEVAYRGYVFQNLGRGLPLWLAVLISSLFFAVLQHANRPGFTVAFVVAATLAGILFVFMRLSAQSLWLAIGFHVSWDWAQGQVYGLDSPNRTDYGHVLLHVQQHGPAVLVGYGAQLESGLLPILMVLIAIACFWWWMMSKSGRINWRGRLNDEGQTESHCDDLAKRH